MIHALYPGLGSAPEAEARSSLTDRRKATGETDPIKVIAKLREMKNAM
jgi:hypothetical protein